MFDIGRLCMKIAGRDAGQYCIIVEVIDKDYVLIDGLTRRRKCNVDHLEPFDKKAEIATGADHAVVIKALNDLGIKCEEKKATKGASKKGPRPKKQKVKKASIKKAAPAEKPKVVPKKEEKKPIVEKKKAE